MMFLYLWENLLRTTRDIYAILKNFYQTFNQETNWRNQNTHIKEIMQMTERLLTQEFLMMQLSGELLFLRVSAIPNEPFLTSSYLLSTMWCRQRQWRNEKIMRKCLRYCCCLMPNPFGRRSSPFSRRFLSLSVGKKDSLSSRSYANQNLIFCCSGDCDPFVRRFRLVLKRKDHLGKVLNGENFFLPRLGILFLMIREEKRCNPVWWMVFCCRHFMCISIFQNCEWWFFVDWTWNGIPSGYLNAQTSIQGECLL